MQKKKLQTEEENKRKEKRREHNKKVFHNLHWKTLALSLKEIICKWIFFSYSFSHLWSLLMSSSLHSHGTGAKTTLKKNNTVVLQLQES